MASTASLNDGIWHSLVFNFDCTLGNSNELWIDGALDVSQNAARAWNLTASGTGYGLYTGDSQNTFWASYVGDLAEVALFETKLGAAQVAAYHAGFPPPKIMQARPSGSSGGGLYFYAPLVRDAYTMVQGNTATITGTTVSDHPRVVGGMI